MINLYVGYDEREAIAYHVFCHSVIKNTSIPVKITPLVLSQLKEFNETHQDRSNDFVYSRFLTPYLNEFNGWAIFADGDMICQADLKELIGMADNGPTPDEVAAARDYAAGVFGLQLETSGQVATRINQLLIYGLDEDHYDRYRDDVRAVNSEAAAIAAAEHMRPSQAQIVVVGDADAVAKPLEELDLASVEIVAVD